MEIKTLVVGELKTNCYLVFDKNSKNCLIIDPADDANFISEKIIYCRLKPVAILATHGHFDHILAASELQMAFKIPFLVNKKDESLVKKMNQSASWWLKRKIIEKPPAITGFLKEKGEIKFGKNYLTVMKAPGHTPGGVYFYHQKEKVVFTGDNLFEVGIGRTDFTYSSTSKLKKSLKKAKNNFTGFITLPGHGPSFYL